MRKATCLLISFLIFATPMYAHHHYWEYELHERWGMKGDVTFNEKQMGYKEFLDLLPCEDINYLKMQNTPEEQMTDRELLIYYENRNLCKEWKTTRFNVYKYLEENRNNTIKLKRDGWWILIQLPFVLYLAYLAWG